MVLRRIALGLILSSLLWIAWGPPALAQGTPPASPPPQVQKLFAAMTPEERVGQLFLVTFDRTDTSDKSNIYDLIANQRVGGVVLVAANDNFAPAPDTVPAAFQLTRALQQLEWDTASNPIVDPTTKQLVSHAYVPLFIALTQDGDGPPGDQIFTGLTPLPSELAIGATWSTDLA
jgi:beta-N-acetylhexosaminidase